MYRKGHGATAVAPNCLLARGAAADFPNVVAQASRGLLNILKFAVWLSH